MPDIDGTHICIFESLQLGGLYVGDLPWNQFTQAFSENWSKRTFVNSFYEAYTTLIQKSDKDVTREKKNTDLGIPWQPSGENLALLLPWSWVQSLVKELRSHKLCSMAKKTNKKTQITTLHKQGTTSLSKILEF